MRDFNQLTGKFVRMACLIWSEASDQSDLIRKLFANEDVEIKGEYDVLQYLNCTFLNFLREA